MTKENEPKTVEMKGVTAPTNELSITAATPATAPDDSLPLRDVPKDADQAPNPLRGNTVKCPHSKTECGFESKPWEGLPHWQCARCGFDTMDAQIASIRRPDVVKV